MEIEIVTPAGRKKYLEILYRHLKSQKDYFNTWTLWVNTAYREDVEYCKQLKRENDWIEVIKPIIHPNGSESVYSFYKYACNPDKIYIKIDDDIVWMEKDFIKKLVDFRVENPEYFLVFANIINNAIIDHLHMRSGAISIGEVINYNPFDNTGWFRGDIAEKKHNILLQSIEKNDLEKFKFCRHILFDFERVSINCISWLGKDFKKFDGIIIPEINHIGVPVKDDEQWLASDYPKSINKANVIYGKALCSHYSFYTQLEHLSKTDVLERYALLA